MGGILIRQHFPRPLLAAQTTDASPSHDQDQELPPPPSGLAELSPGIPELEADDFTEALRSRNLWPWRRQKLVQVALFAVPALSILLADPIMTLVDTVCVAQFAGSMELAACGPCTLVFNFANYVFMSLNIATVNLVAEKLRREGPAAACAAYTASLYVALGSGLATLLVLEALALQIVCATGCAPQLVALAVAYVRIRALAAPAVLAVMVSQAAMLAQKDSATPARATLLQAGINIAGDVALVAGLGWGLAGAAAATVAAQYCGAAWLLLWAMPRSGQVRPVMRQMPSKSNLRALGSTLGPMSIVYFCKNFCYLMLQASATVLSPLLVAAHQPIWVLWNLFGFCQGPIEQAALAFLPPTRSPAEARHTAGLLLGCGAGVACCTASLVAAIPRLVPGLLTPDAALWPLMQAVTPQASLALLLAGIDIAATGVLIARKDLGAIVRAMLATTAATTGYLALARGRDWGLAGVWWGLIVFFGFRVMQSSWRLASTMHGWQQEAPAGVPALA